MLVRIKDVDEQGNKIPGCYKHLLKLELEVVGSDRVELYSYEYVKGCLTCIKDKVEAYIVKVIGHKQFTLNKIKYKKDELKGMIYRIDKSSTITQGC